jgi:hypothetical protein
LGTDDSTSHFLLALTKRITDLFLIVTELRSELAPDGAEPWEVVGI